MLLSIIIPTYNRVHYLENLLCSIVKQIDIYSLENTVDIFNNRAR
jgi:glycosyltransferase involved in cell wall biosynthesis